MKFKVFKTSDRMYCEEIEFTTLEEFMEWCAETGQEIVIMANNAIEIYDDNRE